MSGLPLLEYVRYGEVGSWLLVNPCMTTSKLPCCVLHSWSAGTWFQPPNTGQLRLHMRGQLGIESIGLNKIQGKPFHVAEVRSAIESLARRNPLAAEQEIA